MVGNVTPHLAHRSPELLQCRKIHVVRTLQLRHNILNFLHTMTSMSWLDSVDQRGQPGTGLSCCQNVRRVSANMSLKNLLTMPSFFYVFFCSLFVFLSCPITLSEVCPAGIVWNAGHLGIPLLHQLYAKNISVLNSPFHWAVKEKTVGGGFPSPLQSTNATHTAPAGKKSRSLTYLWYG